MTARRRSAARRAAAARAGMPTPAVRCTPSRLAAFDCPRRYRFTYLDRPAPPRGRPWAHNTVGATDAPRPAPVVAAAARAGARPTAARRSSQQQWQDARLPRRRAVRRGRAPRRPAGSAATSPSASTRRRAGRRRAHRRHPHRAPGGVRPHRPGRRPRRRAGRRRLQDRPAAAHRRRRPRLAGAGRSTRSAVRRTLRRALHAGSSCTTCRPAPSPPFEHTERVAAAPRRPRRGDRRRHRRRHRHARRRRRPRRGLPGRSPGPACSWCDFRRHCQVGAPRRASSSRGPASPTTWPRTGCRACGASVAPGSGSAVGGGALRAADQETGAEREDDRRCRCRRRRRAAASAIGADAPVAVPSSHRTTPVAVGARDRGPSAGAAATASRAATTVGGPVVGTDHSGSVSAGGEGVRPCRRPTSRQRSACRRPCRGRAPRCRPRPAAARPERAARCRR